MKLKTKELISTVIPSNLLKYLYLFNSQKAIKINSLQLIYFPIPKVANRSIKEILANKINLHYEVSAHRAAWNYISIDAVSKSSYYSFSFVRNPLDRLVSCFIQKTKMKSVKRNFWKYGNLVNQKMSFEEFAELVCRTPDAISDKHFKSQHKFLTVNNEIVVDFIGKYEQLEKDWDQISKHFDLAKLSHANKSVRNSMQSYYTKALAKKVLNRYKKDIEIFGYSNEINTFIETLPC